MHPYASDLQAHLTPHADPLQAGPMKAYMRGQFEYLGLKTPRRVELTKAFIAERGLPEPSDLDAIARDLWSLPEREFQYCTVGLIERLLKKLPPEFVATVESLIVTKSWWDTVDTLASNITGPLFKRYPGERAACLPRWRQSDNFWLRRTAILFQLDYKKETDFPLLCDIIRENLGSKEFFINKAIGWVLREVSKTDPEAVRRFVADTPLEPLSRREALKWLDRNSPGAGK
ncbi:MAG: DNA alkylation repair protein [Chloroflexota bacterium]